MYDIAATKACNGVILYYTTSDNEEDGILTKLSDPNKNNATDKLFDAKVVKFVDIKYSPIQVSNRPDQSFSGVPKIQPLDNSLFYSSYFRDIFSPPPDYFRD